MKYQVEKLADLDYYSEGPVRGAADDWYVTTLSGGKILRVGRDGRIDVWAEGDCPNGQIIVSGGEHWCCESRLGRIVAYDADGRFLRVVIDGVCGGVAVQTPNDLLLDSLGNLYFTDSLRTHGKVFFLGVDGDEQCIADDVDYANGIALSPDETRLYVAESYRNRIRVYDLTAPGKPKVSYSSIDLPMHYSLDATRNLPDGLAVDQEGRLWVAHYGMQVLQLITPEGTWLTSINTKLPLTSNLTFISDTPSQKQILVTGGYGEPGPGAVMLVSVFLDD